MWYNFFFNITHTINKRKDLSTKSEVTLDETVLIQPNLNFNGLLRRLKGVISNPYELPKKKKKTYM